LFIRTVLLYRKEFNVAYHHQNGLTVTVGKASNATVN